MRERERETKYQTRILSLHMQILLIRISPHDFLDSEGGLTFLPLQLNIDESWISDNRGISVSNSVILYLEFINTILDPTEQDFACRGICLFGPCQA